MIIAYDTFCNKLNINFYDSSTDVCTLETKGCVVQLIVERYAHSMGVLLRTWSMCQFNTTYTYWCEINYKMTLLQSCQDLPPMSKNVTLNLSVKASCKIKTRSKFIVRVPLQNQS